MLRVAVQQLGRLLAVLLLAGFLGATLVRMAPGFDVDENEGNLPLRPADRPHQPQEHNIVVFYVDYWSNLLRGDLGQSRILNRPVKDLLRERIPITLHHVAVGLLLGWGGGFLLAIPLVWSRSRLSDAATTMFTGLLLCVPSALIALALFLLGSSASLAIGVVLLPQVFFYLRGELQRAAVAPHLLTAQAKGLGPWQIAWRHTLPQIVPPMLALAGVTVTMAFGAAIPIETFGDVPGIGQLTLRAAMGRDLPLLVNLLLLLTFATLLANQTTDLVARWWIGRTA